MSLVASCPAVDIVVCDISNGPCRNVRILRLNCSWNVDYIPWTVNLINLTFATMKSRMEDICSVLGSNVKALRQGLGISQEELAFRAELDRTYISQIERGVSNPSIFVLLKVANVLDVELVDLFSTQN